MLCGLAIVLVMIVGHKRLCSAAALCVCFHHCRTHVANAIVRSILSVQNNGVLANKRSWSVTGSV